MYRRCLVGALALLCLCLAAPAMAAVPTTMSYQGYLADADGKPVTGEVQMVFSLYAAAQEGSAVWSETQTVTVDQGAYSVLLGSVTPMELAFNQELWLGVKVGEDPEMTPRIALASVPYAKQGQNVIVVAKSGGNFTTIGAALASITGNSVDNRWLVQVGPGVYSEKVTMLDYVDIRGAGQGLTFITHTGGSTLDAGSATVTGAAGCELRDVTVISNSGISIAIGVYSAQPGFRVTDVTITASGGSSYDIGLSSVDSDVILDRATVSATGGSLTWGVGATGDSAPSVSSCDIQTTNESSYTYAIYDSTTDGMTIIDSSIAATSGGTYSFAGVYLSSAPAQIRGCRIAANATNASGRPGSLYLMGSTGAEVHDSTLENSGGLISYAVYLGLASELQMIGCRVYSTGASSTAVGIDAWAGSQVTMVNTRVYAQDATYSTALRMHDSGRMTASGCHLEGNDQVVNFLGDSAESLSILDFVHGTIKSNGDGGTVRLNDYTQARLAYVLLDGCFVSVNTEATAKCFSLCDEDLNAYTCPSPSAE